MRITKVSKANIFLIAVMMMTIVLLCFSSQIQAAQEGYYTYSLANGEAQITRYLGVGGDVVIPNTLGGAPVTSIGQEAFAHCAGLKSVTIPEGVASIGKEAFAHNPRLTSISIPKSVTSIGESVFYYCTDLTSITVDGGNSNYASIDSVLYNKAGTTLIMCPEALTSINIPEGVTIIGEEAFFACEGLTSISLPESVTSIGDSAFARCKGLTSIIIPKGVTGIGRRAFEGCENLKSISIPEGVTSIGEAAFESCKGLTSITIPEGVTSINDYTFDACRGLKQVNIPESVTSIGVWAFMNCSALAEITIPEGVKSIGVQAFSDCSSLTSINIPESVTSIGKGAFSDCPNLKTITVDAGNPNYTSIDGVLYSKAGTTLIACPGGLTSINIPESVISIGEAAFRGCAYLKDISLPEGLTSIGNWAFKDCIGLTSITIPPKVASINEEAFGDCTNLTSITFESPTTKIDLFEDSKTAIKIPEAKIIGYANSTAEKYAKKNKRTFEIIGTVEEESVAKPIAVTVNGTTVVFDQPPVILKGRTMVPLRAILEALGTQVNWDAEKQTVTATKGAVTIIVEIGSKQATVNGAVKTLDVPALIIKNRTMVPVRFISESLGAEVNWDGKSQTVKINQ